MVTPASTGDGSGASASEDARTWTPGASQTTGSEPVSVNEAMLVRGEHVGRYLILACIGQGGMGVVYAAHDPELDRKVALKLLRVGSSDKAVAGELRTRLLREAQALAQLNHPAVVTVHDVGTHGDRVWIAMEFIAGVTWTAWLQQQPRRWPEVVAMLRRAGAGLAAAHAAGLVHRDFKPDNVMVSADGRVRVMDFGLARAERTPAPVDLRASASALEVAVTQAGAVMGTPQYMAPEQWLGAVTDARTDQFAFCVTLWEALYHQRPYGETLAELARAVPEGRRREPPGRTGVPTWLRDVLERGLATSPDARWPDMSSLLAALAGGAGRRRRRLAAAAGSLFAAGLAGLAIYTQLAEQQRVQVCEAAGAGVRKLWDDAAREQLHASLLATRVSYATMTFEHLTPVLDDFADAWQATQTELCLRHAVTREMDTQLAERGYGCLLEARWSLEALLTVLAEREPGSVQPAISAASRLPAPASCLDPAWLAQRSSLPADEATRSEVAGVRRELARARATTATGRHREGAARAQALVVRADATGWRPLAAQVRVLAGDLFDRAGDPAQAERLLEDGFYIAVELGEDGIAADAATSLADVVGDNQVRFEEGLRWGRLASGMIDRLGQKDGTRAAALAGALAGVHEARGDHAASEPHAARALALWEQLLGADHPSTAIAVNNLAIALCNLGRTAEARQMLERSLASTRRALGPTHPNVAAILNNLGNIHLTDDELDAAQVLFEQALKIRETSLGPDHPTLAISLLNLAGVAVARDDFGAAQRFNERAVALYERSGSAEHPELATAIEHTALIHRGRGELDAALAAQTRAQTIRERRFGRSHPETALGLHNLGDIQRARGELADAERSYTAAIEIHERTDGPNDPQLVGPLRGLGETAVLRGQPQRALALFERAVAIGALDPASPRTLAEARFSLARALHPTDPARAHALAIAAVAGIRGTDAHAQAQRAEVTAWLAAISP